VAQTSPPNQSNILGVFTNLIALLGAGLYFTGWIYRWAYFGFFKIELISLDLPVESFFMVPIQVFVGNGWAMFKTVVAAVITLLAITVSLKGLEWLSQKIKFDLKNSFIDELIIVIWILAILFHLARIEGIADAQSDANNLTSSLPTVTIVGKEERLAAGRKLGSTDNPSGFRIIGDRTRYNDLLGTEITNSQENRVWRLLLARNGYWYIFKALAKEEPPDSRPPVIIIKESDAGDNLLIISPQVAAEAKPQK
jgi:hypothetical protein